MPAHVEREEDPGELEQNSPGCGRQCNLEGGIEGMQKEAAIGDTVNFASRIEQANKDLNNISKVYGNLSENFRFIKIFVLIILSIFVMQ